MKRKFYIFSLWMATMTVLLSTVVAHHHHMERICFVEERCQKDGNINDEHTRHHENEQEGCQVHQLHKFITNAHITKAMQKHILDGWQAWTALAAYTAQGIGMPYRLVIVEWQDEITPVSERACTTVSRRGPPLFSLS